MQITVRYTLADEAKRVELSCGPEMSTSVLFLRACGLVVSQLMMPDDLFYGCIDGKGDRLLASVCRKLGMPHRTSGGMTCIELARPEMISDVFNREVCVFADEVYFIAGRVSFEELDLPRVSRFQIGRQSGLERGFCSLCQRYRVTGVIVRDSLYLHVCSRAISWDQLRRALSEGGLLERC
jgi:hypothetical protein